MSLRRIINIKGASIHHGRFIFRCVDMEKSSYVYMMANAPYGTLYVGSTTNLVQRIWQHREGVIEGFTKQHGVKRLVWYEIHGDIMDAGLREKQIKLWKRDWKVNLIQGMNPDWRDLYDEIVG